ncbi:hypothetical protein QFC24_000330 [Naganishia onofrii]|uniref:Uncharacterized protein n=1 Tax=Naganishia onofrii TaxID=1851511 RepID=A0ACC2XX92_9TREE|nr:hypothetical protein QFC24_000330 [Naganishia onofrii]
MFGAEKQLDPLKPDVLKVSILGKEAIHVGFHLIPYMVNTILTELPSTTYMVVTDTNLGSIYLPSLAKEFHAQSSKLARPDGVPAPRLLNYEIPPGEGAKSRKQKELIEDYMLDNNMRGVKFVQIPTTLLAMVDSAVGGKTAVDTPHGKNFIGAFWQPSFIFADLSFLESLGMREFSNGMAEVVKTAAIWKDDDFALLESRSNEIIAAVQSGSTRDSKLGRFESNRSENQSLLLTVVTGSIYVKSHIVTIDERETGLRNLVNFGHTIGHAIEAVLTPKMLHGECVSIGIILEAEVARQLGILSQVAVGRLTRCLAAYGLPVSLHDSRITSLPASKMLGVGRLLDIMKVDKKNSGHQKKVVLLSRIGKTYEEKATSVDDSVIQKVLCEAVTVKSRNPAETTVGNKEVVMSTPGSKSISNRALVLAALGNGTCRMRNLLHSDDTAVMMAALSDLKGAIFSWEDGGDTLVVEGGAGNLQPPKKGKQLYLGNAGTAARFLTAVCTLVQAEDDNSSTIITGNARMKQRPIGPLVDALRENGSDIKYLETTGCLPLDIKSGGLHGGHIKLAASVSSQYVSAVLLCAPYAKQEVKLELIGGQVISQPYIDMTIAMMKEFGVEVTRAQDASGKALDVYTIPQGSYVNPSIYNVESDASSATYPLAIAAITGTTCTITNIGSSSLQGDAAFAKKVLEPMGCKVHQTATQTTVTGPPVGQLRALHNVDMETMTDAFLTATVLAAVAVQPPIDSQKDNQLGENVTRIYGIANQRVKECNRIQAMRDQLRKFGVETDEFDDGIIVFGKPVSELKGGADVHCYDDHRVAMAFSVLSCVVPETIITEKRCVEKTWPNWWDDLSRIIGIPVEGVDLAEMTGQSSTAARYSGGARPGYAESATMFLIGMRGAGKSYLGGLAAQVLERQFLDADEYFVDQVGVEIMAFVTQNGWPAFREKETELLKRLIETKPKGYIISLGGGIVETPEARQILKDYSQGAGPVIHIVREINEIRQLFGEIGENTSTRPSLGEPAAEVFKRRQPWFYECSTYDYVNYTGAVVADSQARPSSGSKAEALRFFRFIAGVDSNRPNLESPNRTSFLSLTVPDVTPLLNVLDHITVGVDAIELRVDLLSPSGTAPDHPQVPPTTFVAHQLAALRHHTSLPIVYSVRTASQGGSLPDLAINEYFELVHLGIRAACEFVDLEIDMPEEGVEDVVAKKGCSLILASWHDWSGKIKWNEHVMEEKFNKAASLGDISKIVGTALTADDNTLLGMFRIQARKRSPKPFLAINMGSAGQLTRILNPVLTPVTHPLLPSAAAPGQMSYAAVQQALHLLGQIPARQYYLFGHPISASLSPLIHNTGFNLMGLPHKYSLHESEEINTGVTRLLSDPTFGGASVTIPHKIAIMPYLTEVSADARTIGAVNTITVKKGTDGSRILYGDNSDWRAIYLMVQRKLPPRVALDSSTGLVIGAGGTCRAAVYAIHKLGIQRIFLYNRTVENAKKVKDSFPKDFNIECVTDLDRLPGPPPSVIISTVPGASLTLDANSEGLHLKPSLLSAGAGGVVVDMAYRPNVTALIQLAKNHKEALWNQVTGIEVLCEQAFVQFEGWTNRRAPANLMRAAAFAEYHKAS